MVESSKTTKRDESSKKTKPRQSKTRNPKRRSLFGIAVVQRDGRNAGGICDEDFDELFAGRCATFHQMWSQASSTD